MDFAIPPAIHGVKTGTRPNRVFRIATLPISLHRPKASELDTARRRHWFCMWRPPVSVRVVSTYSRMPKELPLSSMQDV